MITWDPFKIRAGCSTVSSYLATVLVMFVATIKFGLVADMEIISALTNATTLLYVILSHKRLQP